MSSFPRPLYAGVILMAVAIVVPTAAADPSLDARLATIRAAFLGNDSEALARQFPRRDRVYVAIRGFERVALLGPGPVRALVKQLTSETRSIAFEFLDDGRTSARDGGVAYRKARWTYLDGRTGALNSDDLFFSLRRDPEDGEWRIVALKTGA